MITRISKAAYRLVFIATLLFPIVGCNQGDIQRPNILIIMADDLGYSDLGSYGGEIATPNLDKLAKNGLKYTQFYNTGRCWPTRASLLAGYYPQQIGRDSAPGIKGGGQGERPDWAQLLPEYLKEAGYRSYHTGKWHIDGMPIQTGFDRSYMLEGPIDHFRPVEHYENDNKLPRIKKGSDYYSTTEITDRTIKYLKEHESNYKDHSFFSYVAFTAPHFPLHALEEDINRVGERYNSGWNEIRKQRWKRIQEMNLVEGRLSEVERDIGPPYDFPKALEILGDGEVNRPVPWDSLTTQQKQFQQDKMTIHAAMIERMDKEIGRIIDQLKALDYYNNTLIVFLSDNGASSEIMVRGNGHDPNARPGSADTFLSLGPGWSTVSNTPFRRHKTWVHEGGIATPFIVQWLDGIEDRGSLRTAAGHVIDLVPTVLDLAGLERSSQITKSMPGRSLVPTFDSNIEWDRKLWWYHEGNRAMRAGDWKIVASKDEDWRLFNLEKDRAETNNLAENRPEKIQTLKTQWNNELEDFKEIVPKEYLE
ncbi:arylsulfatase [Halalkalibaculum sp. DA3122]|uniref:arylsulfatase n=1 Tax=unclassified Halalkalibaculum TaxID=2964617 RepID=UPI0037550BEC